LQWLRERWHPDSDFSEPRPEDWGWYSEVIWKGRRYSIGASATDGAHFRGEWVLHVSGRGKVTLEDSCVCEIRRLIETESSFHGARFDERKF